MLTSTDTRENSNSSPSSSEDHENNDPLLYLLSDGSDSEDPSAVKLGVISYHPDVKPGNVAVKTESRGASDCKVPMVRVRLVQ